jgi:hypothetical protein
MMAVKIKDKSTVTKNNPIPQESSLAIANDSAANQYDDNFSSNLMNTDIDGSTITDVESDLYKAIYHGANIYRSAEVRNRLYEQTFRFGLMDRRGLSTGREYLFFTKPDLNIISQDAYRQTNGSLQSYLSNFPFWVDAKKTRMDTIKCLEYSLDTSDPFIHLLQNKCISNLDIPGLSAETVETAKNAYGVGYSYRGSSEQSDDNPSFSLEFKDTKYLDVYLFFKMYEEYETLKHHGIIKPSDYYITRKILHDQFAIYKFIVADDMETIIYYGKMYGVMPVSLPRDVFSTPTFDDGITYSVDFKAAFYEDMKPDILSDFNKLSSGLYNTQKYQINPYNQILGRADTRPAKAAAVVVDRTSPAALDSPTGYLYKLKWRGSDRI